MKNQWISILIVGLTLGTTWAVKGQFGHEQGAAWAGGIGALALVLVSQRKDWYSKMLMIAFSSAIGWGAGGMISYGQVVGYGRSDDLLNASYGFFDAFCHWRLVRTYGRRTCRANIRFFRTKTGKLGRVGCRDGCRRLDYL